MPLLRVQKSSIGASGGSPDTSRVVTFTTPPVLGNGIVVVMNAKANTNGMSACVDNYGNTYSPAFTPAGVNVISVSFWYCPKITATGPGFTITGSGSSTYRMLVALEISGVGAGLALGPTVAANTSTAGGQTTGPTAALTAPESLVVASVIVASGVLGFLQITAGAPAWTEEAEVLNGGNPSAEVDSRLVNTTTAQSAAWTWSGAAYASSGIATFYAVLTVTVPDVKGKAQAAAVADLVAQGLAPGQIKTEKSDKVPPGHVIRQDPEPPAVVPPGTPVNLVVSGGAGTGTAAIANLPGKVNGSNQLLVTLTAPTTRTASIESTTALLDAVLIPAPPPGQVVIVTRLSAAARVAGAFDVVWRIAADRIVGPIWLPGMGPLAVATDRLITTGPIRRALPPGEGLRVTTSADAPQTLDAEYEIAGAE